MEEKIEKKREPSLLLSVALLLTIIAVLVLGIMFLKVDIHILLIIALIITSLVSVALGYTFEDLVDAMKMSIGRAMVAMIIFILIGIIIGSWIYSGTVPAIIYYGLKFLSPRFFLPAGLIICSITSLCTGTSWGTAGTVGIALMGIGEGLGIPAPLVAGMIISGAFFGDKISPISDTTNLAAVSSGTNLYKHIGGMLYTTIPSYIIVFILYSVLGWKYSGGAMDSGQIQLISSTLENNFNLNPIVLLPMLVLLILTLTRFNAVPAMAFAAATGTIVALIFQGGSLAGALNALSNGYTESTGVDIVDRLLLRGGIHSMMWTFSLSFIALCLGGVLERIGFLHVIIGGIITKVHRTGSLAALVIGTTGISTAAMGEIYLGIILNGSLYREVFEERGLDNRMLSRLIEEGGTLLGPLIPWTTAGVFMAATLGVSTLSYIPYTFLNLINPVLSIVLTYMGIFVFYKKD